MGGRETGRGQEKQERRETEGKKEGRKEGNEEERTKPVFRKGAHSVFFLSCVALAAAKLVAKSSFLRTY